MKGISYTYSFQMKVFLNVYKTALRTMICLITSNRFAIYYIIFCYSCTNFTKKNVVFKGPVFFLNTVNNKDIGSISFPTSTFANANGGILQTEDTNITLSLNVATTTSETVSKIYFAKANGDGNKIFWDLILSTGPKDDYLEERLLIDKNSSDMYFVGYTRNSIFGYILDGLIGKIDLDGVVKTNKVFSANHNKQTIAEDLDWFNGNILVSVSMKKTFYDTNTSAFLVFFEPKTLNINMAKIIVPKERNITQVYHSLSSIRNSIVLGGNGNLDSKSFPSIAFFDNLKQSSWGYLFKSSLMIEYGWDINFVEFIKNGSKVLIVGQIDLGDRTSIINKVIPWFALLSANGTLEVARFLNISSDMVSALELKNGNILVTTNTDNGGILSLFFPNGTQIGIIETPNISILALSKFGDHFVMNGAAFNSSTTMPFYAKLPKGLKFDKNCTAPIPLFWKDFKDNITLIPQDFELKNFTFNCTTPNVSIIRSVPDINTICFFQPTQVVDLSWIRLSIVLGGGLCCFLIICAYCCCCYLQLAKRDAQKNRVVRFQNFSDEHEGMEVGEL